MNRSENIIRKGAVRRKLSKKRKEGLEGHNGTVVGISKGGVNDLSGSRDPIECSEKSGDILRRPIYFKNVGLRHSFKTLSNNTENRSLLKIISVSFST